MGFYLVLMHMYIYSYDAFLRLKIFINFKNGYTREWLKVFCLRFQVVVLRRCKTHYSYQLLKRDPTTKIKAKTLKQLMDMKDNEFINNNLYNHLEPTDSSVPIFSGQPKIHKPGVPIRPIVSYCGSPLYNLNKYIANILIANMFRMKITTQRILPRFLFTSEMFPFKMMR